VTRVFTDIIKVFILSDDGIVTGIIVSGLFYLL
jgi:hypothetical protein